MRNKIFEKIESLQRGPKTLKKFFPFTMEDLTDDYEGCLDVIEEYIERHKDKILDFEFESWIDEVTMTPVLMMKMYLVPTIASHISSLSVLNNLLPSSTEADILREEISNLYSEYAWEFNDEKTRSDIMNRLQFKLAVDKIIDKTSTEHIDGQEFNFFVIKNGKEMSLNDYINSIADAKRYED